MLATCWLAVFALAPAVAEAKTSGTIIRYGKSGGIAGVSETLRVRADGVAFATSRGAPAVRARLTPKRLARLRSALKAAHLETLHRDYPAPGAADTFVYSVTYQGHTVTADQTRMPARLRKPVALLEKTFGEVSRAGKS